MVFLPTHSWGNLHLGVLSERERIAITNLLSFQLTGYNFFAFRTVGDQPGQGIPRYLDEWKKLPEGVYIPESKFWPRTAQPVFDINDLSKNERFLVYSFTNILVPFPFENSTTTLRLPCIAFDFQGRLSLPEVNIAEFIPLAQGSVLYPRDPQTKLPQIGTALPQEKPPGNVTNGYNLVRIDWLTGRGHLERREIQ